MPTTRVRLLAITAGLLLAAGPLAAADVPPPKPAEVKAIAVHPAKVRLTGSDDATQLVVTATLADGRLCDLTTDARYRARGNSAAVSPSRCSHDLGIGDD